jgi:uncharacterized protein (DUF2336 family)
VFIAANVESPPLLQALAALRERLPRAAFVLLCVYPERAASGAGRQFDAHISKDTCRRDLIALFDTLTEASHAQQATA